MLFPGLFPKAGCFPVAKVWPGNWFERYKIVPICIFLTCNVLRKEIFVLVFVSGTIACPVSGQDISHN